ncbi:MAG: VCBS repeat-containing protein [Chthonomonas sp.]|nr:VCBS repeat-containing protein [Chthonomonas sp.]
MRFSRCSGLVPALCAVAIVPGQTITFASLLPITSVANPKVTLIGDFTGDGKKDLGVLANAFFVIPGDGFGFFGAPIFSSTGGPMVNAAAGDFNEDGLLDFVCADGAGSIKIMANQGAGTFLELSTYPAGAGARFLALSDFNNDTHLDIAVAYPSLPLVTRFMGTGTGSFSSGINTSVPIAGTVTSMAIGDMNNDGKQELALNYGSSVAFTNWSGPNLVYVSTFTTSALAGTIVSAYVDSDLNADIVAASNSTVMSTHRSTGGGFIFASSSIIGGNGVATIANDLNGDGRAEIITGSSSGPQVFAVQTNGTMLLGSVTSVNANANPIHIASGDLTSDGRADLVTTNTTASVVSVLVNSMTRTVTCNIALNDFIGALGSHQVEYRLKSGTTTINSGLAITSMSGQITFNTTAFGSYTLSVETSHWLRRQVGITITNSGASASFTLPNGDADLNGEVDAGDIDLVISNFGNTGPSNSDLDGTYEVDFADIDIVISNFGAIDD